MLTKSTATRDTHTLTWPKVEGATGFRFYKNGVLVSTTGDGTRTSVRFGSLPYGPITLGVSAVCPDGEKNSSVISVLERK